MLEQAAEIVHPAATVVILRDGDLGVELLLLRRNRELSFYGGVWVFPGGRIDPQDYVAAGSEDPLAAARHAAIREAREEAGLTLDAARLVPFARWITPDGVPKRFDTWFFAAPVQEGAVRVDGGEIHDHRWFAPSEALAAHRAGELELPPPTFVTIAQFAAFSDLDGALADATRHPVQTYHPRICAAGDGGCCLYDDDVAYDTGDLDLPGPRNRLWMLDSGWRYEKS